VPSAAGHLTETFSQETEHDEAWALADTPYPFLLLHGPHGYMLQFRGVEERDAITKEYEGMLARLCKIKGTCCLPH